jgi:hypothetical protein
MRDVAILALLYGVSNISQSFNLEESLLLTWISELGSDTFFKSLRTFILSQNKNNDKSFFLRKYSLSANVVEKISAYQENSFTDKLEINKMIMNYQEKKIEKEMTNEEIKSLLLKVTDYTVEEWYLSDDVHIVTYEHFLNDLKNSSSKLNRYVRVNNKEETIAEVIKEGLPMYRETARKLGENPRRIKEWINSYKSQGRIRAVNTEIRPASDILSRAIEELRAEYECFT